MLGYVNELLQRQDRVNMFSKLETFNVETAARKTLKQLISGFEDQYKETVERTIKVEDLLNRQLKKYDQNMILFEKLQHDVTRCLTNEKRLKQLEDEVNQSNSALTKQFQFVEQKLDMSV